ncbi:ADP-ribosylglycohydrolase family protein [Bacillus sp. EB01]|uniref:ADP-ribosylglycohydrolase family protein n=1 Tax=Bacillus sp. EB01 TaxID=1347086 RepID=UPI000A523302|nr:ADP-ribosylglycohydrolase family protein [Bacillus sp. EB01]
MNHYEAIIEALTAIGGEATIREVDNWIGNKYPNSWKTAGTALADMVPRQNGGNNSSNVREEYQVIERVAPGRYRLLDKGGVAVGGKSFGFFNKNKDILEQAMKTKKDFFIASLLGGAVGDGLGYSVEFMTLNEIKSRFGVQGITDLDIDKRTGRAIISDDTQMTLFTADGILWSYKRMSERGIGSYAGSGTYQSYLRWYYTQTRKLPNDGAEWLLERQPHEESESILTYKELFFQRAPGNTCLSALESGKMGQIEQPINNSKGCGGVMRVAPVGLFLHREPDHAFRVGAEFAAITHGHPTGYLSAGALSAIIAELINGKSIINSAETAMHILKGNPNHQETLAAIEKAVELSTSHLTVEKAISKLGEGWIAEEALAIALYCALKETDFRKALIMAVNHDGDSDSTGSICGNILGACYGMQGVPKEWASRIELKDFIINMGLKLYELSERAFARH